MRISSRLLRYDFGALDAMRLLDRDPDLIGALPSEDVERLRGRLVATAVSLPAGRIDEEVAALAGRAPLGAVVLDGFLLQHVLVERRRSIEILGPRDVVKPWLGPENYSLPMAVYWEATAGAELALLDEAVAEAAGPAWPIVTGVLVDRLVQRSRWLMLQAAVAAAKGVDTRLLLTLWHLADRWGRVTPEGVLVPLALTHHQLAELLGARRPSVSTAFGALASRGLVSRHDSGWILHGAAPRDLPALEQEAAVTD